MQLRCLLDTIEVEEPIGLNQIGKVVKRDRTEGSILVTQDAEVTFVGDGFDYLYNLLRNSGFCVRASCTVQITIDGGSTWTNYYEGLIPISTVEFDLKRNLAKTKIFDNSYNSKIDNSKSIGAFLYGERSRNDVAITPIPYQTIQYFSVTTGTYITQTFNGGYEGAAYRPFDVMRFLIEFMTDGEIGFASSVFDTGGEYEGLLITHGRAIELADQSLAGAPPCTLAVWKQFWDKVDWEKMFSEFRNRRNLSFAVDYSTSPISIRVENESYFRENGIKFSALNVDELKVLIDEAQLYSKISLGQGGTQDKQGTSFPFDITFLGYKDEEFATVGNCNIDAELNIKTDWITNTNDIEYLLVNGVIGTEDWDRKIFIIDCDYDSGINWKAKQSQFLGAPNWYYNESLTNAKIVPFFAGAVPNSIVNFLSVETNDFRAEKTTSNITVPNIVDFDDDSTPPNFDTGGNYDNTTYEYTAPISAAYTFEVGLRAYQTSGGSFNMYVSFFASNGAYGEKLINMFGLSPIVTDTIYFTAYLSAGDTCYIAFTPTGGTFTFDAHGSYFKLIQINGNGVIFGYDPEDIAIYKNIFSYPMSVREMDAITSNPKGLIEFSRDGGYTKEYGWIDTIKHTPSTGIAQITLTSTKNLNKNGH